MEEGDEDDSSSGQSHKQIPLSSRPGGRLLFRFVFEPNNLTRENTFSLLGFSAVPLLLLGLPAAWLAIAFLRSLACLLCRMRELAIAAAIASLAA